MSIGRYESYPPKETLKQAVWCVFSEYGLSYQSCRFCKKGIGELHTPGAFGEKLGLWKYAVRHYICPQCRDKGMSNPAGRMSV